MATNGTSELLVWLRGREGEMRDLLERLARAESPSLDPQAQEPARAILTAELEAVGYRVRRLRGETVGDHLYARAADRPRRSPYQLVVGHLDTIWPLGMLDRMPVRTEGDELYGPGVFDMKGGLTQLLFALRALHELHYRPEVGPVVLINTDEEIGSVESRRYLTMLARGAERAFILEGAFGPAGKLKTGRKGVGRFVVTARGRAAHAGVDPQAGVSAILEISHQIQRLFALNDPERGITVNVGTVDGGLRPNVIAPEASAEVDVRVPSVEAAREVERAIRALEPVGRGIVLEIEGGFRRLPMERTPRNAELWVRAAEAAASLGIPVEEISVGGASDGNITSLYTATLDGLGPMGEGAHAFDEHVLVSRMPERAALLAALLLEPAGDGR
jgi:glutamate carboxypeptidase